MDMNPEKMARHNYLVMILEGMVFYIGLSFLQTDTVVAKFIDFTSHSTALMGLAASIGSICFLLGQVFCGAYIHRVRAQARHMVKVGLASRGIMLVLAAALALGLRGLAATWLFLVFFAVFQLAYGIIGLCFTQIAARTLPVRKRGEMLGMQQAVCGVLGIATGFALQKLLTSNLEEYTKFAIIFAVAGGVMLLSVICLAQVRDTPHPSHPEQPVKSPKRYAADLIPFFKAHRGVRQVLLSRCIYAMALMTLPINFKFGQMNGLSDQQLAMLVYIPVAGRILAGLLWSQMSRLKGYPTMMLAGHVLGLLTALMNFAAVACAAAGRSVMLPLCAAMLLVSVNSQAGNGYSQHMIAIVDEESRASYIVLMSLISAPMAFNTTFAGFFADNWGFVPVYAMVAVFAILGIVQTWHFFFSARSPLPEEQRNGAQ